MKKIKDIPDIEIKCTPDHGLLGVYNAFFLNQSEDFYTNIPLKDLMKISKFISLDRKIFENMFSASIHSELKIEHFLAKDFNFELVDSFNDFSKRYKNNVWIPNIEKTNDLSKKLYIEFLSNQDFFSDMAEFYGYKELLEDKIYIGIYPNYKLIKNCNSLYNYNKDLNQNTISLPFNENTDFYKDINANQIHEISHFYFRNALGNRKLFTEVKELFNLIKDEYHSLYYLNESYAVAWQNIFYEYLYRFGKIEKNFQVVYGNGEINHDDFMSVDKVSIDVYNNSIITILSGFIKEEIIKIGTDKNSVTKNSVQKLKSKIPSIERELRYKKIQLDR